MIQWIKILTTGANVAEIARDIYITIKKNKKEPGQPGLQSIPGLELKVNQLEENELRQAALISKMAEQQRLITKRLATLSIISIGSIITAIAALVLHFL